jgi:hypothetical protein
LSRPNRVGRQSTPEKHNERVANRACIQPRQPVPEGFHRFPGMAFRRSGVRLPLAPPINSVAYGYTRRIAPKNVRIVSATKRGRSNCGGVPVPRIVVASFRQGGRLVTPVEANGGQVVPSGCGVQFGAEIYNCPAGRNLLSRTKFAALSRGNAGSNPAGDAK